MSFTVRTNIASMTALRFLGRSDRQLRKTMARVSSGNRMARASDDAAGMAVSENLDAAIRSLTVARRNTLDGMNVIDTAEQATGEVANILKRLRELAVQASSETLAADERQYIQEEFTALEAEINRIANITEFNGQALTDGSAVVMDVQVGIANTANDRIGIATQDLRATTLGVDVGTIDMSTSSNAQNALANLDTALDLVNGYRSSYGASQNRLESAMRNLDRYTMDMSGARSRVQDADYAFETAQLAKYTLLRQTGEAVLGQTQELQRTVVSLIDLG